MTCRCRRTIGFKHLITANSIFIKVCCCQSLYQSSIKECCSCRIDCQTDIQICRHFRKYDFAFNKFCTIIKGINYFIIAICFMRRTVKNTNLTGCHNRTVFSKSGNNIVTTGFLAIERNICSGTRIAPEDHNIIVTFKHCFCRDLCILPAAFNTGNRIRYTGKGGFNYLYNHFTGYSRSICRCKFRQYAECSSFIETIRYLSIFSSECQMLIAYCRYCTAGNTVSRSDTQKQCISFADCYSRSRKYVCFLPFYILRSFSTAPIYSNHSTRFRR